MPINPPGVMEVRGGVWFDLLEPLGVMGESVPVNPFEPPGMMGEGRGGV